MYGQPRLEEQLAGNLATRRGAMDSDEEEWSDGGNSIRRAGKGKLNPNILNTLNGMLGGAQQSLQPQSPSSQSGAPSLNRSTSSATFAARAAALQAALSGGAKQDEEVNDAPPPPPDEGDSPNISPNPSYTYSGGVAPPPPSDPQSDEGEWLAELDPNTGATYYYNTATGETNWTLPEPKPKPVPSVPSASAAPQLPPAVIKPSAARTSFGNQSSVNSSVQPSFPSYSSSSISSSSLPQSSSSSSLSSPWSVKSGNSTNSASFKPPLVSPTAASSTTAPAASSPTSRSNFLKASANLNALFGGGGSASGPSTPRSSSNPPPVSKPDVKEKEKKWLPDTDPATGATYYYNVDTQETSWTNPEEESAEGAPSSPSGDNSYDWGAASSGSDSTGPSGLTMLSANSILASFNSPFSGPSSPKAAKKQKEWEALIDPDSGATYYYNRVTQITQWEVPDGFEEEKGGAESFTGRGGEGSTGSSIYGTTSFGASGLGGTLSSRKNTMDIASANTTRKHVRKLSDQPFVSLRDTLGENFQRFTMLDYGRSNFGKHSRGMFSGEMTVDEQLSHSTKLVSSLHKSSDPGFQEMALQAFKNITGFMLDRSTGKDPHGHVIKLASRGIKGSTEFRDEIYCLCIKQTTNNKSMESCERGWQLIALLCGLFPPSERLQNYLYSYLMRGANNTQSKKICEYSKLAMDSLDETMRYGPRIQPPTLVEVTSVECLRPVVVNIETLDPAVTWPVTCSAQTRVKDVYRTISEQLQIPFDSDCFTNFSLFQTMLNKGRVLSALALQESSRILDVISFWNSALQEALKKNSAATIGFKFVFKVDWYLRSAVFGAPEMISHLYYMQGVHDILRGMYCPTEKESLWLAALMLQVRYGDAPATIVLEELVPVPILSHVKDKSKPGMINEIEKLRATFRGTSKGAAKDQFLGYVHQWKNYGMTCFAVRGVSPKSHKIDEVGMNENGIFKIEPKSRQWWILTPLEGVLMYEVADDAFKIVMGSKAKTDEISFYVDYPEEMKKLMQKYKLSGRLGGMGEPQKQRTLIPIQKPKH